MSALKAGKQHDFGPKMRKFAQAILRATGGKGVTFSKSKHPWGGSLFPDGRGLKDVRSLLVSHHSASALTRSGEVFSWGTARHGTIGRPEDSGGFWPPMRHPGLAEVTSITGGSQHRCALLRDGTVACFGQGAYLGQGNDASSLTARSVPLLARIQALAASDDCTFALDAEGTVWAWGDDRGQHCGVGHASPSTPRQMEFEAGEP
jgi:alpha-tubulin suppressor-like RCC1 family protein